MDWFSLLLPVAYLTTLISSLGTFSYLYRRRKAVAAASLRSWFPPHTQRNIYLSLLELQSAPDSKTKVPDSVLRAALLRRATEDIHRLIQIRAAKPAVQQLLQRGSVGDELMQRFQLAEKEIELELKDVVTEANALAPGQNWGQTIFQSAGECAHIGALKDKLKDIESQRVFEREEWEKRRKETKDGFLKEVGVSEDTTQPVDKQRASERKQPSSEEDVVLVEADSEVPGSSKKKKSRN